MNREQEDLYGRQHEGVFHTHRSERYRHPEQDSQFRSGSYGTPPRGSSGSDRNPSRNYTDIPVTPYDRFEQSHNYGSMGSYGGAQGFGDVRGGRHEPGHPFDSGMSSPRMDRDQSYSPSGYRSQGGEGYGEARQGRQSEDYGRGSSPGRQDDLYGHDTSRRFQGSSGQGRYDFERDNYYNSNYGDDQGNYMGSGYHRMTQGYYGTGDYGSSGHIEQGRQERDRNRDEDRERGRTHEFNTAKNRWNTDW